MVEMRISDARLAELARKAEMNARSARVQTSCVTADLAAVVADLQDARADLAKWLAWSDGRYPDDSPGDVIHALSDGTITLDDGITTWNPLRALAWIERGREENAARAAQAEQALSRPTRAWFEACLRAEEALAGYVTELDDGTVATRLGEAPSYIRARAVLAGGGDND